MDKVKWDVGGRWASWGTPAWAGGYLGQRPRGSLTGNMACKAEASLAKAWTLESPPSQLGRYILRASGGLGKTGLEGSGHIRGRKVALFFSIFFFPSISLESWPFLCSPGTQRPRALRNSQVLSPS